MKLRLLAAAVAASLCSNAWAQTVNLGLDATCAYNGTDGGQVTRSDGTYRLCELPGTIAVSGTVTLPATVAGTRILWTMWSIVTVGDGHQAGKTPSTAIPTVLQILPGTKLTGGSAAALVITRGARLNALGTPTAPIVFSSFDDDFTGRGQWGGVILSSWDNVNACNTGNVCLMEGVSINQDYYYGGYIDEASTPGWDKISSGTVRHTVVAEAGRRIYLTVPGNGLTLYGVSSETSIHNVHVHNSDEDAIKLWGGDADLHNLWLTCSGDDSVVWKYGFHGWLNNLYILQQDGADHAFELSNNAGNYVATPLADASISNVTLDFLDATPIIDYPFRLEHGTGGTFSNIQIGDAYTGSCFRSGEVDQVDPGDFTDIEYACTDNLGLLPASNATGFPLPTFWTSYPGTCN